MRFMRESQSGTDKQVLVPEFRMNKDEAHLVLTACNDLLERLPKKFMFSSERTRLRNIIGTLKRYLYDENN